MARHDAEAAARVGDGLIDAAEKQLAGQPRIGPRCPEYPTEEIRYWLHRNYRIVYEIDEANSQIQVLRFWHCSKGDWPVDLT
ncbi:MAG: type II toxin-antitoxin system RelE/ParE family toxin [Verrucomicrobiae bacterium]|nr:type II toxin-antitoxin system RelE/ParE family toxin [Verrucomicrobiae bacterium]